MNGRPHRPVRRQKPGRRKLPCRIPTIERLENRRVLDSTVVFNELMYHGAGQSAATEWIELHNQMGVDMDLSGWRISGGVNYHFPQGTTIPGRGYLVVATNPQQFESQVASETLLGPLTGRLSNNGERLVLRNNSNREMDVLDYDDTYPWTAAADGSGATLAKIDANAASAHPENWTHSPEVGGTPGSRNFPATEDLRAFDRTLIERSESWRYDDSSVEPPAGWNLPEFDDVSFSTGVVPLIGGTSQGIPREEALVGYWNFDGNVQDISGTGNHGLRVGATYSTNVPTAYASGQSLRFTSNSNHVYIRSDNSLNSSQFTLSMYVYDQGQSKNINRFTSRAGDRFETGTDQAFGTGSLAFYSPNNGWQTTGLVLPIHKWSHVAFVASGSAMTIYVDGLPASDPIPFSASPSGYMHIGNRHNNVEGFRGFIDEVGMWNVALTETEIRSLAFGAQTGQLSTDANTYYLRNEFSFTDAAAETTLRLNTIVDDGAIFYLNGEEVHRSNMPTGAVSYETDAVAEIELPLTENITIPSTALRQGDNVLAVELHHAEQSQDATFDMTLTANILPPQPTSLPAIRFSEITAANASDFFVEIVNRDERPVDLSGYQIVSSAHPNQPHDITPTTIETGEHFVVDQSALGFPIRENDRLFLFFDHQSTVLDAVIIEDRNQARTADHLRFITPVAPTPGAENHFALHEEIVINEIMYHPRGIPAVADIPATYETNVLLPLNSPGWRYNETGENLGATWHETAHAVDDSKWFEGEGPLGYETAFFLPTQLNPPTSNTPRVITYYFETDFTVNLESSLYDEIQVRHLIDDGAIFYLNGQEVLRYNLPAGPISANTVATSVNNATVIDGATIPADRLRDGTNRLSVEVHQTNSNSSDVVMGVELIGRRQTTPLVPGAPFRESDNQWIELFNRSTTVDVELSGWQFSDGIDYDFAAGTTLTAGEYLVVARDPIQFASAHPDVQVVGPFGGSLARQGERLELTDDRGNPADIVRFYDGGRWHDMADGGGSSLELRDPDADNRRAQSWRSSDEQGRSDWQTITYRGTATRSSVGPDNQWREFALGLLDAGQILLDDIRVVEDPDGAAIDLIQNGSFESDAFGTSPSAWRLLGTHGSHGKSHVVPDPLDPANHVLHVVATDPMEHMFNHVETTLADGRAIQNGREYEISYQVKWLSGSDRLNSRLYFNRLAKTTPIVTPTGGGTPGRENSQYQQNVGPTYTDLQHQPVVPAVGQDVLVSVVANDPDNVSQVTLWYSVETDNWTAELMSRDNTGRYVATIPGQLAREVVQFYVEGRDSHGTISTYPADGRASRALYQVADGRHLPGAKHNIRIVMTQPDSDFLLLNTNALSNERIGATVIYDESTAFYDVGIKLKGSERGRTIEVRRSFNLRFQPDQPFRGVHETIAIDRSGAGNQYSQKEILVKHIVNHAGDVPGSYDDLVHVITPQDTHTGSAMLMMARYNDVFLDSQFTNGSDGNLYEYELVYYPRTTVDGDPESLKLPYPSPDGVIGTPITDLGDNQEDYRYIFLQKNNRAQDDYSQLMKFSKSFKLSGNAFLTAVTETIDVDQWLRAFAVTTLAGIGDSYSTGAEHNLQVYVRPEDGRVLFFPHDMDFSFTGSATASIIRSSDLNKLVSSAANLRTYLGHIHDIVTTTFNRDYMQPWVSHYNSLLPESLSGFANFISSRATSALNQVNQRIAPVEFSVTTENTSLNAPYLTIEGQGWVNVRQIYLEGAQEPLDVTWTDQRTWKTTVPLTPGANPLTFTAFDFQGQPIGTSSVTITSNQPNALANLRLTEINYRPDPPTGPEAAWDPLLDNDDFEFLEIRNVGSTPLPLNGLRFVDGVGFDFPSEALAPGGNGLIVRDRAAFELRYGADWPVLGEYTGGLNNAGERIAIADGAGRIIIQMTYDDQDLWPRAADGHGASLELRSASDIDINQHDNVWQWRSSTRRGGSPGAEGPSEIGVSINEIIAHTDPPTTPSDSIELINTTADAVDLSGWFLSDDAEYPTKFRIPSGTILEAGEYVVFNEENFNPTPLSPESHHFALSGALGDEVWLIVTDQDGSIESFVDQIEFSASFNGQALGRFTGVTLLPLSQATLGAPNSLPEIGAVVISEIALKPQVPNLAATQLDAQITADDLEYIELHNQSADTVHLANWRLRGGADFDFDAAVSMAAGETLLVVPFAATNQTRLNAFRAHYSIGGDVRVIGGFDGRLSDPGESLRLQRPDSPPPERPDFTPHITTDYAIFLPHAPWPTDATGQGLSLHRGDLTSTGSESTSWTSHPPSPGVFGIDSRGDFDDDGALTENDIQLFFRELAAIDPNLAFDLTGDGHVDTRDRDELILNVFDITYGDANLDGVFNTEDFVYIFITGEYLDGIANNSTWGDGDWNGDGEFDENDIVLAFITGGFRPAASRAVNWCETAAAVDLLFADDEFLSRKHSSH